MHNPMLITVDVRVGIALPLSERLPPDAEMTLNAFILNIALPAVILRHVQGLHVEAERIMPAAMPWVMLLVGAAFSALVGRLLKRSRGATGLWPCLAGRPLHPVSGRR